MATAVSGGLTCTTSGEVLRSHRASELIGQSPLPLLPPGSAEVCGLFVDHRFVANAAMATAVSGGLTCTTSGEVLRLLRASELTGQSPLPFLTPPPASITPLTHSAIRIPVSCLLT
jgi:hypothetical protein